MGGPAAGCPSRTLRNRAQQNGGSTPALVLQVSGVSRGNGVLVTNKRRTRCCPCEQMMAHESSPKQGGLQQKGPVEG